jgi:cytochrome b pre-mRNA-processing protein 3
MFSRLRHRQRPDGTPAFGLYTAIVAQARRPGLYRHHGVPDTVDGRFEMIVLHLVLLFHRLGRDGTDGNGVTQAVFDLFVTDMDRSLREMGVGDLGVPRRMKAIGRSFYGRLDSYGRALTEGDRPGLATALQRNLFPDGSTAFARDDLADYAFAAADGLALQSFAALAAGAIAFTDPAEADGPERASP